MATNIFMEAISNNAPHFPEITVVGDLHALEGSLWRTGESTEMFCQVASAKFAMIALDEGNRNINSFGIDDVPVRALEQYKRFHGKVILTTL